MSFNIHKTAKLLSKAKVHKSFIAEVFGVSYSAVTQTTKKYGITNDFIRRVSLFLMDGCQNNPRKYKVYFDRRAKKLYQMMAEVCKRRQEALEPKNTKTMVAWSTDDDGNIRPGTEEYMSKVPGPKFVIPEKVLLIKVVGIIKKYLLQFLVSKYINNVNQIHGLNLSVLVGDIGDVNHNFYKLGLLTRRLKRVVRVATEKLQRDFVKFRKFLITPYYKDQDLRVVEGL